MRRREFLAGLAALAGTPVLDRIPSWIEEAAPGKLVAHLYGAEGDVIPGTLVDVDDLQGDLVWGPFTAAMLYGTAVHDLGSGQWWMIPFGGPVSVVEGTLTVFFPEDLEAELAKPEHQSGRSERA